MKKPSTYSVLLVDDDPAILKLLSHQLGTEYTLISAESGDQALEILKSDPNIRVIISDLEMDGMDGVEFFQRTRAIRPGSVRLMMTSNVHFDAAADAVNIGGVQGFIAKPSNADAIAQAIENGVQQVSESYAYGMWTRLWQSTELCAQQA